MLKLLLIILGLSGQTEASNWIECHYQARVIEVSGDNIQLRVEKHLGGDGFGGDPGKKFCNQHLGPLKILAKDLGVEAKSLKANEEIKVSWMSYSAMGEDGPVQGVSWQLLSAPLPKPTDKAKD